MPGPTTHTLTLRDAAPEDAGVCGRIFFDAFAAIAGQHDFPVEPGSAEFTAFKAADMLVTDGIVGRIAELDGEPVACAFADTRDPITGIGPVAVAPGAQDHGAGRALMEDLVASSHGRPGVRLVQTAYHYRSLALYSKLGFVVREPLTVLQGPAPSVSLPGRSVRPAGQADLAACDELCFQVHGHVRHAELAAAIEAGTARVVEDPNGISGYASGFGYGWHAVARTNDDLAALLAAAEEYRGLGILLPTRNAELLRWCLAHGLRIVQQSTLMSLGLYSEPRGAWLPSILL
jgi:GNAT superfamily N-acetyltransferase